MKKHIRFSFLIGLVSIFHVFPCYGDVIFSCNFNRTVDAGLENNLNSLLELCKPSVNMGSDLVHVGNGVTAGSYMTPRGAWKTPGVYINGSGGIRYETNGNVSKEAGTIEFWCDKDFGAIGRGTRPQLLSVDFGNNDYIDFYGQESSFDYVDVRVKLMIDGNEVLLSKNYLKSLWPSGYESGDGGGFNHFAVSYDLRSGNNNKWVGFWINGQKAEVVYTDIGGNGLAEFSDDISVNQFTIGNIGSVDFYSFDSIRGIGGNIDGVRVHNAAIDDVYLIDGNDDFEVPGLVGAEYLSVDNPTTLLVTFNEAFEDVNQTCVPDYADGNGVAEIIGSPSAGTDYWPHGAWQTYGLSCYTSNSGLHFEAVDNVPRNNGTIEFYNNRYLPDFPANYNYNRFIEVRWDENYNLQAYIDSSKNTSNSFTINVYAKMGASSSQNFYNYVTIALEDFPFEVSNSGNTGMVYYAVSWNGSSEAGVSDGWVGLWINGDIAAKWVIDQPYFWGSGNGDPDKNTFAIGLNARYPHTTSNSNKIGGSIDGVRVSALPIDELYSVDVNGAYEVPGYIGNEFGTAPQQCGKPGTVYFEQDFNTDCVINFLDFSTFASEWMRNTSN